MLSEKEKWIINYIKNTNIGSVDMLNEKFVDDYIEKFNPKHQVMPYGANSCFELSKLLSSMYQAGILNREAVGLSWTPGFPKWIYHYSLTIEYSY